MTPKERELTKSLGRHKVTWKDRARELRAKGLSVPVIAERLGKPVKNVWVALGEPKAGKAP